MLKKIGKIFLNLIIAFSLALIFWWFCLIRIPEHQVQGTSAPVMTKEEALDFMDYHGVKVIWAEGEEWVFERDGKTYSLIKKK
ncbi:hypothetical protein KAW18_01075 [candidate division WOR-3 bacterium]|nr:hypothetical protein [candidate division WOR-3 bacterium]